MSRLIAAAAAVLLAGLTTLPAATARMPLDQVRPGMTGEGITVFRGGERERFGVEVLGVLENALGPRRSIIVARLSGGPLADAGVMQGMSGSPVYIDDRLVGAVSYALGSFPKEPIAGITPIDEMTETDSIHTTVARRAAPVSLPLTHASLRTIVRETFGALEPFASQPNDVKAIGLSGRDAGRFGTGLRPIATPVVMSGFVPEMHDLWAAALGAGGFVPTIGGSLGAQQQLEGPLMPGDPVGAGLVQGDLAMAATGTVTLVDEGRVYAFGHPFYNLGPVRYPMMRAQVTTVLPSLAISSKIAAIGDVIGTFDQDRSTGVFGSLGPPPPMIPVRVTLRAPDRALSQTFTFEVIDDRIFTPLMTYTSVLNTFFSWTRQLGTSTYVVDATTRVTGQPALTLHDIYSGDTALVAASTAIIAPLTTLLSNDFASVSLEGIDVDITSLEEPRTATLQRVWVDATRPRAGDTVPLRLLSRSYRGADIVDTLMIPLPAHVTGSVQIQVSDGMQLQQRETTQGQAVSDAVSLDQMIQTLNRARRNNRLYVRVVSRQPGAVVKGTVLPALPGSVLAVLDGDRSGSGLRRLDQATLGEWEIETDHVISGSRTLTLTVEAG